MNASRQVRRVVLSHGTTQSLNKRYSSDLLEGTNTLTLGGRIVRHGEGDALVTLNVGGTEFLTLRSTIATNSVLADHVARAERNAELTQNGAVFIDRDPKHFALILNYLRDHADSVPEDCSATSLYRKTLKNSLNLPNDRSVLQELYAESVYFRIKPLQDALCHSNFMLGLVRLGGGNPFTQWAKLIAQMRAALVAVGTVGTVSVASTSDAIKEKLGFSPKEGASDSQEGAMA